MNIDGHAIAREILAETALAVSALDRTPLVRAVVAAPTPATESYLRIKTAKAKEAGMTLDVVRLPDDADEAAAQRAAADPAPDALIVQLPLPGHMHERAVLDAIPLEKDADVLSSAAYELFLVNAPDALLPPVVGAVAEIFSRANVTPEGKRAVIVGEGRLVGAPVRAWLARSRADITVLNEESFERGSAALASADIIISGAGSPHLITPDMINDGAVLIDAGTSELGGAIVGDFDPACETKASIFTPVPGGVGPIAVACLFKNVAQLAQNQ